MTSRGGSALRMMLILSAIDLLSSALTAGLVLFVVLVGGDAGNNQASAALGGSALNLVTIVDRSGQSSLFKQTSFRTSSEASNAVERPFFGNAATVTHRRYFVPVATKRLLIASADKLFEIVVQPVTGEAFSILMSCDNQSGRLEFVLSPLTLTGCQPGATRNSVLVPKGRTVLLPKGTILPGLPKPASDMPGHDRYLLAADLNVTDAVPVWGVLLQ